MTATADFYATLGVEARADAATIRAAYRDLMRRYHPDVNQSAEAVARAIAINEAYACLSDEERRAAYDRSRRPAGPKFNPAYAPRPMRAQHAHFYQQRSTTLELEPDPAPTRWKVASLGFALLVTLITFALTSATPPREPLPPVTVELQ